MKVKVKVKVIRPEAWIKDTLPMARPRLSLKEGPGHVATTRVQHAENCGAGKSGSVGKSSACAVIAQLSERARETSLLLLRANLSA